MPALAWHEVLKDCYRCCCCCCCSCCCTTGGLEGQVEEPEKEGCIVKSVAEPVVVAGCHVGCLPFSAGVCWLLGVFSARAADLMCKKRRWWPYGPMIGWTTTLPQTLSGLVGGQNKWPMVAAYLRCLHVETFSKRCQSFTRVIYMRYPA